MNAATDVVQVTSSVDMPTTLLGKWSVGLNAFFLAVVAISIVLVNALRLLSFDDRWWDVTVPVVFLASIVGLVTGIRSKERSLLVRCSMFTSVCAILFALLHSLFISD